MPLTKPSGRLVTRFDISGTFTVPMGAKWIEINGISASPGAGSGARGLAVNVPTGGAGATGGARLWNLFPATGVLVPGSTVSVTVGAAGLGGAAVTTDNTVGNPGGVHGNLSFGSFAATYFSGTPPQGGGFGVSAGGGSINYGTFNTTAGKSSSSTGLAANNGGGPQFGQVGACGTGGGGITAAGVASNGSQGDFNASMSPGVRGLPGAVDGALPTSGTWPGGSGGASSAGSGAASVTQAAQGGGNGLYPGGGAGGGGASLNGFNSGKGGDGAEGFLDVIVYFD